MSAAGTGYIYFALSLMEDTVNEQEPNILPPREAFRDNGIFAYKDPELYTHQIRNKIVGFETPEEGGMLVWREGDRYPAKGLPFNEATTAADVAKRAALVGVKFITSSPVRYFLPLLFILPGFLKKKLLLSALKAYTELSDTMFMRASAYLEPKYLCTIGREVHRVGMELAGDDETMQRFVDTICMILEYDDAYRYRIQDILGCINRDAVLNTPGKELARVLKIGQSRGEGTGEKFGLFAKVVPLLLLVSCIRNPILGFFKAVDLEKLALDDADWYKCLIWKGYQFRGVSDEHRISMRMMIDADWLASDPTVKAAKLETKIPTDQPQSNLSLAPAV